MQKNIDLKSLFPNWDEMKPDDCATISIAGIKRPNKFLGITNERKEICNLTLFRDWNNTYKLSLSDGVEAFEMVLDDDLENQIIYDKNGDKVTAENDHENESDKEAYDYFFG